MLQLKNVGLDYPVGGKSVHALRRVNLTLGPRGLVLVCGASGSGKSALVRILSGRELPSRGEIAVYGENTARWSELRRSAWRRRVGDTSGELLLPDRTAAENAALSARMAGWRAGDARRQAARTLAALGLSDRGDALPGELSGQERRLAALGCALAREPELLLADEPTEGLERETAARVIELLRTQAADRLVVVFTRDEELLGGAEDHAFRLEEGEIVRLRESPDEAPTSAPAPPPPAPVLTEAMGNLFRPRGRAAVRLLGAFLSVLAVCLGLAALRGAELRGLTLQSETLAAYPLVLERQSVTSGDLEGLSDYLETEIDPRGATVQRTYAVSPRIYSLNARGEVRQVSPETDTGTALWTEMPKGEELQKTGYELVSGRWPNRYDEAAVLLDSQGSLDRACLRALGLTGEEAAAGLNYTDLLRLSFRVVLPTGEYVRSADGTWSYLGGDEEFMADMVRNSLPLKIVGILRPVRTGAADVRIGGALYMGDLTDWVIDSVMDSRVVTEQLASPERDVLTGLTFNDGTLDSDTAAMRQLLKNRVTASSGAYQVELYRQLTGEKVDETASQDLLLQLLDAMTGEEVDALFDREIGQYISAGSLEDNLRSFGALDARTLTGLRIYARTFAYRGELSGLLGRYRERVSYTDTAAAVISTGASLLENQGRVLPLLRAVLIALGALGVILTAALPLLTRRREIAVLRSLGMPGGAAANVLVWETVLPVLLGAVAGALAALLAARLSGTLNDGLTWQTALLTVVAAGLLGALSARLGAGDVSRRSSAEALRLAEE